jgi:hypothetical protein
MMQRYVFLLHGACGFHRKVHAAPYGVFRIFRKRSIFVPANSNAAKEIYNNIMYKANLPGES